MITYDRLKEILIEKGVRTTKDNWRYKDFGAFDVPYADAYELLVDQDEDVLFFGYVRTDERTGKLVFTRSCDADFRYNVEKDCIEMFDDAEPFRFSFEDKKPCNPWKKVMVDENGEIMCLGGYDKIFETKKDVDEHLRQCCKNNKKAIASELRCLIKSYQDDIKDGYREIKEIQKRSEDRKCRIEKLQMQLDKMTAPDFLEDAKTGETFQTRNGDAVRLHKIGKERLLWRYVVTPEDCADDYTFSTYLNGRFTRTGHKETLDIIKKL